VDGLGWFGDITSFFDQGKAVDIAGGDTVEFFVNGVKTTVTLPTITGGIDPATDVVSGTISGVSLPTNVTILTHSRSRTVATDASGNFSTDWTGIADIVQDDRVDVAYEMTSGYWAMARFYPQNGFTVYETWNSVWGYTTPGDTITVTLRSITGTLKESGTATAQVQWGGGWRYGAGVDIAAGDQVEVEVGGDTITTIVSAIIAAVDLAADTVSGIGPANSSLWISFQRQEGTASRLLEQTVSTASDGSYSADFSAEGIGRWEGSGYAVHADNARADMAAFFWAPFAVVDQTYNDVVGRANVGASIVITLTDSGGAVKDVQAPSADPYNGYYQATFVGDVVPGDTVQVVGGGISATIPITTLNATTDRIADVISGQAPPNSSHLRVGQWGEYSPYYEQEGFTSDASGSYTADLSGEVDVHNRGAGELYYHTDDDLDEHLQSVAYRTPDYHVSLTWDNIEGHTGIPNLPITLTLLAADGVVKGTNVVVGQEPDGRINWADFYADGEKQDVVPGDQVIVETPTFSDTISIVGFDITIDPATDVVSGTGPANTRLRIWIDWLWPNLEVPTDGEGRFMADFSGIQDIQATSWAHIVYTDPNFNLVGYSSTPPHVWFRANMSSDWVDGSTTANATVWITATDGLGTLKGIRTTTARPDAWFEGVDLWLDGQRAGLVPGDIITATSSDGSTTSTTLISITGQMDVDNDTISGQMQDGVFPADGHLDFWQCSTDQWSGHDFAIAADGSYSIDLSGEIDIQPGDQAQVWYIAPDGNRPGIDVYAAFLQVRANRTHDFVASKAPRETNVVVRVLRGGEEIGRGEYIGQGVWFHTIVRDEHGNRVDIRVGDVVKVTAGELSATVEMVDMTGTVDAVANTVSSQIIGVPYPAGVLVEVWGEGGQDWTIQTDEAGNFSLDFGEFIVRPGHDVAIWYVQPDGHMPGIVRSHLRLETDVTDDDVWGQTTPGARVDLTLSTPGTGLMAVKATATTWADDEGQFSTQFRDEEDNVVDIAPGDVIGAQADGRETGLQIPSPYSAEYDHEANTVCGEAPPGVELEVDIWGYGSKWVAVSPDGTYCGDPQIWDEGQVSFHGEGGHRIMVRFRTPSPDLILEKRSEGEPVSGRTYDWTLHYRNQGDAPAEGVALEDTLPEGMSFVSASPAPVAVIGNRVIWALGTVEPGDWVTITLTVQVDAEPCNDLQNCAEISTTGWERDTGNNGSCNGRHVVADEVDLGVGKWASADEPAPRGEYIYHIDYNNGRPASALSVRITDTLPTSVTLVSTWEPAGWSVDTSIPGVVVWTLPEMPGHHGGHLELKLRVNDDVGPGEQLWNRVEIATSSDDVDPNNDWHDHEVWTNEPRVNLSVDKRYQRGSPVAGQEYTYWVDMGNGGNAVAPSVVLTDDLDSNLTFVRAERYDWNPSTGENDLRSPITPEAQGERFVRFALGDIPPWRWVGLEITVRINDGVPIGSELTNAVDVASDVPDENPDHNHAEYSFTTQAPGPNLWVRKWLGNREPCVGCRFEYEIEIANDGTEPAANVRVRESLPDEVEYEDNNWWGEPTIEEGALVWDLGTVNPGEAYGTTIHVRLRDGVPAGTELLNRVEVETSSTESRYDDNAAEHRTLVGPDLRVEKELLTDEVLPGFELRYRIRIWNDGDAEAHNVVLTDNLPAETDFEGDDWGGEVQDGQVVWHLGNLHAGWYNDFQMNLRLHRDVPGGTVITNTLDIASDEDDANPDDNHFELASTVESPYHIYVQESHNWVAGRVLPDAYVNATLKDGAAVEKETINTGSDGDGNFWANFGEDIAPGDTVEVDTEGAFIVIEVVRIEGAVDATTDTICGHVYDVAYPADVRGEVWVEDGPSVEVQTDGVGNYTVDFSPFDVKSGHTVGLWYVRPDGHEVGIERSALFVRVYPTDDHVNGQTAPNTVVDVSLRDGDGNLKGTGQTTSDENGDWGTEVYTNTQRVEIDDHNTVEVTAGANSASVYVPFILLFPDAVRDWLDVLSFDLPNTKMEIRWDSAPNMEDHDLANETEVTSGEQGVAGLDFGPFGGLDLGVNGNLYYYNQDGNCVEPWWRAMIASVAPNEFVNDSDHTIFIAGAGFQPTPEVVVLGTTGPPSVVLFGVTYISDGLLQVTVPAGTPAGVYYLQFANPDERIGHLSEALTIRNPQPTVTGIAPAAAPNDAPVSVVISGTNFLEGATVELVMDGEVIPGTAVTVVSATEINATFDLTGAAVGTYDVVATNPGPLQPTGTLPDGFTVEEAVKRTFLPLVQKDA